MEMKILYAEKDYTYIDKSLSHSKTELAAVNSARGVTSSVAMKYIAVPD